MFGHGIWLVKYGDMNQHQLTTTVSLRDGVSRMMAFCVLLVDLYVLAGRLFMIYTYLRALMFHLLDIQLALTHGTSIGFGRTPPVYH